jgi:hypothetical protein
MQPLLERQVVAGGHGDVAVDESWAASESLDATTSACWLGLEHGLQRMNIVDSRSPWSVPSRQRGHDTA